MYWMNKNVDFLRLYCTISHTLDDERQSHYSYLRTDSNVSPHPVAINPNRPGSSRPILLSPPITSNSTSWSRLSFSVLQVTLTPCVARGKAC